ncbi:Ribonuclease MRP protein subunit rmp1 [Rhizina undulata]
MTPLPENISSTETITMLKNELDLLHLLFHRNKNQHHSGKWWKWFGMLRRNTRKLVDELEEEGVSEGRCNEEESKVEKRVVYLRRVLVPSCYTAFTSVIANTQFSSLGMVLLAVLAKIHSIIGPDEEDTAEAGNEEVSEYFDVRIQSFGDVGGEDFGEAIQREDNGDEDVDTGEDLVSIGPGSIGQVRGNEEISRKGNSGLEITAREEAEKVMVKREKKVKMKERTELVTKKKDGKNKSLPPPLSSPKSQENIKAKRKPTEEQGAKKKKKRKKGGDEIDDLFSGLL